MRKMIRTGTSIFFIVTAAFLHHLIPPERKGNLFVSVRNDQTQITGKLQRYEAWPGKGKICPAAGESPGGEETAFAGFGKLHRDDHPHILFSCKA